MDLGSSDRSVEIAQRLGIKVVRKPWVPIVEMILPTLIPTMKHDWVLHVDPDEVFSPTLVDDLLALDPGDDYGAVAVPIQYYFLNKKLDVTIWGGLNFGRYVLHKQRVDFGDQEVHSTNYCKKGFKIFTLNFSGDNFVAHYWIDSYVQLFSKHERYLKMEGKARFARGERFSLKKMIISTLRKFKNSFIKKKGWRGGWTGWFLSFFYVQYVARGWLALRRYENSQKQEHL